MSSPIMLPRALPELIITPIRPGEFLTSNPFTRTHVLGDTRFVELLSQLIAGGSTEYIDRANRYRVRDVSRSPFEDGLLGDPTGVNRDSTLDDVEELDLSNTLALARRLKLVVDDESAYEEFLSGQRDSILDRAHRGNIHQRAGEHVMLGLRRTDFDEWWIEQKFTSDLYDPRPGLYRDVQWTFAQEEYSADKLEGKTVLDFGCGPGLFSRLFAASGARSVIGLDTNEIHVRTAQRLVEESGQDTGRIRFSTLELPPEKGLASLGDQSFDLIFLSDVLMFYFYSYDPTLDLDPGLLLRQLGSLLSPGGCIQVLEPNGTFWQQPWFGKVDRPFTVLTEYNSRNYGVTPTLEAISRAGEQAGLSISRIRELRTTRSENSSPSDRSKAFAAEFPQWWFFEFQRAGEHK